MRSDSRASAAIPTLSTATLDDLDRDGIPDLVAGFGPFNFEGGGKLRAVSGWSRPAVIAWTMGPLDWEIPVPAPLVIDVTDDGLPDVILAGQQGGLTAISGANGTRLWSFEAGAGAGLHPALLQEGRGAGCCGCSLPARAPTSGRTTAAAGYSPRP